MPVTIINPMSQCGMNFICNLYYAQTLEEQIEALDRAFSYWGEQAEKTYGSATTKMANASSQVYFTDNVDNESKIWPEIKKLCHRGPVTHNRRYANTPDRRIAIYILTWDVYSEWRKKWLKENTEKELSKIKVMVEEVVEKEKSTPKYKIPDPINQLPDAPWYRNEPELEWPGVRRNYWRK